MWNKMQSFFLSDEEMVKKDDDHKPAKNGFNSAAWTPARVPPRKSLKRLLILALLAVVVYIFITNIPTDVGIRDRRRPLYQQSDNEIVLSTGATKTKHPVKGSSKNPREKGIKLLDPKAARTYNGPVRFLNLGASLHAIYTTRGGSITNKNVLFAAASLQSAATLLPVACQMAAERRSYVHFALMSRSEIEIDELRQLNGIGESCEIIFHGMGSTFMQGEIRCMWVGIDRK
jgi:hypothetical protein